MMYQNKVECFQDSLTFSGMAVSHFLCLNLSVNFSTKDQTNLRKRSRDKHSSLLGSIFDDKKKSL